MAYRIDYPGRRKKRRFPYWIFLILAFVVLLAVPKDDLEYWLLPGNPEVTAQALSELVKTLRQGTNAGQAVAAFCGSILRGAGLG
uniref:hypothetical protein n=1 Tax=Faecousia sp. TaxID=2952921 RepID=UPI0040272F6C